MMEGVADEGCKPGGYQIAKFENLVIRANALYERFTGRGVRTLEQSNAERNFGSREVFDNYNDAQYQDRRSNQAERK